MNQDLASNSLEILLSVSRELAKTLDLHKVLASVLTLSTKNLGVERASLVVLDDSSKPIDAAIIFDGALIPDTVQQMKDVVVSGLAGWVVQNKKPALVSNTHDDARWMKRSHLSGAPDAAKSALCVPLLASQQLVGVLTIVHPQVGFFTDQQLNLQQAIADLAGIAVRNAQLFEEVQNEKRRYLDLFENSVDPIFVTNFGGKIIESNQKATLATGKSTKELANLSIAEILVLPADKQEEIFNKVEQKETLTWESQFTDPDGNIHPIEIHVSEIHIGGTENVQWILRDISERKNLESLRDDLAAMIYHDLRSPLANIVSSLDLMKSLLPTANENAALQLHEIAERSTMRLQRLISSLVDINRLEAGQPIVNKKNIQVIQLIDEAVMTVSPNANGKHLTIEKMIFTELPTIEVDADMIHRVVVNLLENAIKFSPQDSKLIVGAKANQGKVTLWVEDRGPGIPPTEIHRLFNKYVRLQGQGSIKGLGLGLAFCRLAIEAHGGKIWVENVAEGGSRFLISLPAA